MPNHTSTDHLFVIRALSNLHPGSGDNSFGLIDKIVQRDPTTELPVIYSSSLKGALRELANYHYPPKQKDRNDPTKGVIEDTFVQTVFGSDNRRGQASHLQQGSHVFYDAHLLALPIRSSHQLYYIATTPALLLDFLERAGGHLSSVQKTALTGLAQTKVDKENPICFGGTENNIYLENLLAKRSELPADYDSLKTILGSRIALLHIDDFSDRCRELPTVARNTLNNGISENLWYEEIVPRESRFYCRIANVTPGAVADTLPDLILTKANGELQVGANATVGYGLTRWHELKTV
jgi:CRISPR-associated protein Cmr4